MRNDDRMTVTIAGRAITVTDATLLRTIDTCADGCKIEMPWFPGFDAEIDRITAPGSYSDCQVKIADELVMEGVLYDVTQSLSSRGRIKTLDIWSKTADLIDSTVVPPYEANNIKLTDRCRQQCRPFGINVIVGDDAAASMNETRRVIVSTGYNRQLPVRLPVFNDISTWQPIRFERVPARSRLVTDEKRFSRVSAKPTDTIFSHLVELARQRGLLLSCTVHGDLLITKANVNAEPVGTIEENAAADGLEYVAAFKGRDRFNLYRAIGSSSRSGRTSGTGTARDEKVKTPRILTFDANDSLPGECTNAAIWRRNKSAADAMTVSFPVASWRAPNGTIWKPNTTVTVKSETMGIKNGFTFLIAQVEYNYKSGGRDVKLSLKPPTVYTTGEIELPW